MRRSSVLAALVFLVALNLRPSLTGVGPLLPAIGGELGLREGTQGLLGSLPLLAFGLVSPLGHAAALRLGRERAVLMALLAVAAGVLARSYGGVAGLWLGTAFAGSAIAVANVIMPALVTDSYPRHISLATSMYSACLTATAAVASGVAAPLADRIGWRGSLAVWALPALAVAVVWVLRCRPPVRSGAAGHDDTIPDSHVLAGVWRRPTAWYVTAYMGTQATIFFVMATWLPTIEQAHGVSATAAGVHLLLFQVVGVVAGFAVAPLLERRSQVAGCVLASVPVVLGALGMLLVPSALLVWILVVGIGAGASLVVALTLVSLRGRTPHETTQLSGMAQSVGYLLAAAGPIAAGAAAQVTGSWTVPVLLVAAVGIVQLLVGLRVGRPRD